MSARISIAFVVALTLVLDARADVIVVDPQGGPGGGLLLQQAIDSAHDGDILLLRPGDYTDIDVVVSGKLLSLVADAGGAQVTLRRLTVVPPFVVGTPLVRGVRAEPPPQAANLGSGLIAGGPVSTATTMWLEDCTAFGNPVDADGPGPFPTLPGAGMTVGFVTRAIVVRCEGTGSDGQNEASGAVATAGGAGISTDGNVVIDECTFTGGAGGDGQANPLYGSDGGPGAITNAGVAWLMGCTLQGGDEGADNDESVQAGAGLFVGLGGVYLRDVAALPGDVDGLGTPGVPIDAEASELISLFPAAPRGLSVPAPLREDLDSVLSAHGEPGDAVFVWIASEATIHNLPGKQGAFLLSSPLPAPVLLGVITDPSGTLDVTFHVPLLPAAQDGAVLFLQSAMAPAAGGVVLGSGTAFVWIDQSF